MSNKLILSILFILSIKTASAQIPVNEYRKEILNLKTDTDFQIYWDKLYKIDQEILVKLDDTKKADSLSIDNMIRTALLFEIHGEKVYNPNNVVPIVNLTHNIIGDCQIAFWSIIKKCSKVGGVIDRFGGKFPTYQLESVGLTFYNYSFLNQESKYTLLVDKMDLATNENVVLNLLKAFENQKRLYRLKEIKVLNEWFAQPFIDLKEEDTFSFVLMSDEQLYVKKRINLQKLQLVQSKSKSKIYRIEKEPFGWTYEYGTNGSLTLRDEKENTLIEYTRY